MFAGLHCTGDPAASNWPQEVASAEPDWTSDSAYLATPDGPALLLGFDFYDTLIAPARLRLIVDQLEANGGNYLRVNPQQIDDSIGVEEVSRAVAHGLLLDTTQAGWAEPVEGPRSFHRSLLAGRGRLAFTSFTQAALNGLRGVRTVERHLDFPVLQPDSVVLGAANPTGARAASDPAGNCLIFIPTAGNVTVRLPDRRQVPRRVTVVGHLGTQRSEVLRPPYDRSFTLLSNDARGGWMIIEVIE